MSPKNLQPPSHSAGVYPEPVLYGSVPALWTDASSSETQPPILVPLIESTIVGLPHPFGKSLQGEFGLLQADWQLGFCTAPVWRIVAPINWIIIVVGHLRQSMQVCHPCDICVQRFHGWLEMAPRDGMIAERYASEGGFRWEANQWSPRSAGRRFRWRIRTGRCCPIDWMVFDGPGGTIGAPGDIGPCPGICGGGNICDPPSPPWWRSYPYHRGP